MPPGSKKLSCKMVKQINDMNLELRIDELCMCGHQVIKLYQWRCNSQESDNTPGCQWAFLAAPGPLTQTAVEQGQATAALRLISVSLMTTPNL
jgi:hypothetical protein